MQGVWEVRSGPHTSIIAAALSTPSCGRFGALVKLEVCIPKVAVRVGRGSYEGWTR